MRRRAFDAHNKCIVCYQLSGYGDDEWTAIAMEGGTVLLAGEDFRFRLADEQEIRQDAIGAEQATPWDMSEFATSEA